MPIHTWGSEKNVLTRAFSGNIGRGNVSLKLTTNESPSNVSISEWRQTQLFTAN